MEGMTSGWKKSVKKHHFFQQDSNLSLCGHAYYKKSAYKNQEFLNECEITTNMKVCSECWNERKDNAAESIKRYHRERVGFWDNSYTCPSCGTPVIFFSRSGKREHLCTICQNMVELQPVRL